MTAAEDPPSYTPAPQPIIIAVFGKTGTGKTTFIKNLVGGEAGSTLKIGHGLSSCTQEVQAITYTYGNQDITLVDTPGFDDTYLSDTEVLNRIADWLLYTYNEGTYLTGLVYLHRISDQRMDGASMKNLNIFRKLCGTDNLRNVVLATTMWGKVSTKEGEAREAELQNQFWTTMIENGSCIQRLPKDDGNSARSLIRTILSKNMQQIMLQLQVELAGGSTLLQTEAGLAVQAEIEIYRRRYEEDLRAAKEEMYQANHNTRSKMEKEIEKVERKLKKLEEENTKLRTAKPASVPRQSRRWWQRSWRCLWGCGDKTRSSGYWNCGSCGNQQNNVRY